VSTPNRSAQIVLFCGFAADHQFATETTHIGGSSASGRRGAADAVWLRA